MIKIEVITGPMYSGKTEELIRRINNSLYEDKKVLVLKPARDTRSDMQTVVSRRKNSDGNGELNGHWTFVPFQMVSAVAVKTADEANDAIEKNTPETIAIDEAQFFDEWILDLILELAGKHSGQTRNGEATGTQTSHSPNLTIIISGLDLNFKCEPFGIMPRLMAIADEITKLKAVCFACKGKNGPAVLSKKIAGTQNEIEVGDNNLYEARCRACYER